jgi:Domain of unknown function (DUF4365)
MSFHHLGYFVAKSGHSLEGIAQDYGYDGSIFTFDVQGQIESSYMFVQLKATDRLVRSKDRKFVKFVLEKKDLNLWQNEIVPVYLVVFDAKAEKAYWVYLQRYLEQKKLTASKITTRTKTIWLNTKQLVNQQAIERWRQHKATVVAQIGRISHA